MVTARQLITSVLMTVCGVTGCATREKNAPGIPQRRDERSSITSQRPREPDGASSKSHDGQNQAEPLKLAAYEVRESVFCDFGMSVKTNFEVKWGGSIEWMLVSGVDAGRSAARLDLRAGDRILAIDSRVIADLDRDAMLAAVFQRIKGDRAQLLVLGVRQALPRFVTLTADRAGSSQ